MEPDDVRRYCLPCSEETGRLARRVAPALDRKRADAAASRQAGVAARRGRATRRRALAAQRETARWTFDGVDMRAELRRFLKLPTFRDVARDLASVRVAVHRGSEKHSSGHHKLYRGKIHVTLGTGPWYLASLVLLHEVSHAAHQMLGLTRARLRRYRLPDGHSGVALRHECHDTDFHDLLRRAACQAYGLGANRVAELHTAAGGYRKAYAMDEALRTALAERYDVPLAAGLRKPHDFAAEALAAPIS